VAITVTPVADFTADATYAAVGQTINFTDLSLNTPTSWAWNFGDSTTSILQNPTHAYGSAGLFTVDMTATNSAGSDSSTKTNYIETVAESPYGVGQYGTGGYKCQGGTAGPELHYYALKKIMPYELIGSLDDDLHIEGKYLDECYYWVGGSDPQSPYSSGGLLPEFFGNTVDLLLPDWLRIFDLETSATSADVLASQYLLAHKNGQLTKSNYVAISADLGFTIDPIYEGLFDMFIIGDATTLIPQPASQLPHKIYDVEHIWHWYVTVTAGPVDATARALYEARINELKPGFTQVHFTYL
jgi:PKD repeat protein